MVSVQPGSLVVVTGLNGHVASCVALRLLQNGYKVRGTVRAAPRAAYVVQALSQYSDSLDVVEVPDIAKPGAFDVALEGAAAIIHISSPVTMDAKKPEEQYVPSVDGTLSIMRSAHATPSVTRFLYLGSIGSAVMNTKDPSKEIITGEDWNVMTEKAVENLNDPFIGFHIYIGSKLVAEKAAWAYMAQEKPSFSFSSILGAMAFGPIHKAVTQAPRQDVSLGQLYDTLANPPRVDGLSPVVSTVWVHAYDIADLFVASLTSEKTPGRRLVACAGRMSWLQAAKILQKVYPDRPYPPETADAPCMNYPGADVIRFDTSLEEELLGGKWRTLDDAVLSCARDLIKKEEDGWDKL
ncbi:hypothetical protein EW146_g8338 [Bondarzewia mesenterica]|uniref:NAD-dependent epimerase/dehydratase domain-containing protein n=1 Tax=Bondarzewia mesenterica TaxID=1095465 RepID=A0A4V6S1A9_9AGAM|nr:hypothetical protein EW146_g8338 [Bondarzewia mesenterica]